MNCPDIRKLLTEYLEGNLDDRDKKLVEEHLAICKGCSEELASIKAYFKEVGSLEKVKAPGDFLEKVHQRLERRFAFEKIMRTLFVPVRVKIPLELAAVVTTVILGIFIYRSALPPMQLATVHEDRIVTKAPSEKASFLTDERRELTGIDSDVKERPIVIALLIMPEGISRDELTSVPLKKATRGRTVYEEEKAELTMEMGAADQEEKVLPSSQVPEEPLAEISYYDKKEELRQKTLWDMFLNVRFLIINFEGKIMSIGYDKEKDLPQSITAEIPSKHYEILLENLNQFGMVQYEPKDIEIIEDEKLALIIQFKLFQRGVKE